MHESFSSALNEMSVADAVMQLASGTVELALEDAPEFARWCWFADVLDPDWGLTGRLPSAGDDVLHELERVAGMCRTSGKEELNPEVWRAAYVAPRDQPKDRTYPVWRPHIWCFRRRTTSHSNASTNRTPSSRSRSRWHSSPSPPVRRTPRQRDAGSPALLSNGRTERTQSPVT